MKEFRKSANIRSYAKNTVDFSRTGAQLTATAAGWVVEGCPVSTKNSRRSLLSAWLNQK